MKKVTQRGAAFALRCLQDRLCVYQETLFIRVVQVAQVTIDDWGVTFTFQVVSQPGFKQDDIESFSASAAWQVLGISDAAVWSTCVPWTLVVRPDLVDQVKAAAAGGMRDWELWERVYRVVFAVSSV